MTNEKILREQILKMAIDKAEKNGWQHKHRWTSQSMHYLVNDGTYSKVIFSHDFAKAFWPTPGRENKQYMTDIYPQELWQYHLQQMVLEPDPIKYLERFLVEAK